MKMTLSNFYRYCKDKHINQFELDGEVFDRMFYIHIPDHLCLINSTNNNRAVFNGVKQIDVTGGEIITATINYLNPETIAFDLNKSLVAYHLDGAGELTDIGTQANKTATHKHYTTAKGSSPDEPVLLTERFYRRQGYIV